MSAESMTGYAGSRAGKILRSTLDVDLRAALAGHQIGQDKTRPKRFLSVSGRKAAQSHHAASSVI